MANNDLLWHVILTKPKCEKKIADFLSKKNIETFCPLCEVEVKRGMWRKAVSEPLFQLYVFIRISKVENFSIRQIDGIKGFVYWLNKPAIISAEEIEVIRQVIFYFKKVRAEKAKVNCEDRVKIFTNVERTNEETSLNVKYKTIRILLPSLGFELVPETGITLKSTLYERNISQFPFNVT